MIYRCCFFCCDGGRKCESVSAEGWHQIDCASVHLNPCAVSYFCFPCNLVIVLINTSILDASAAFLSSRFVKRSSTFLCRPSLLEVTYTISVVKGSTLALVGWISLPTSILFFGCYVFLASCTSDLYWIPSHATARLATLNPRSTIFFFAVTTSPQLSVASTGRCPMSPNWLL